MNIRFNRYHVTNGTTKTKCRYDLDNHVSHRPCVRITAKDYSGELWPIFGQFAGDENFKFKNNTEIQFDYFDKDRVYIFEGHPIYKEAREAVQAHIEGARATRENRKKRAIPAHADPTTPGQTIVTIKTRRNTMVLTQAEVLDTKETPASTIVYVEGWASWAPHSRKRKVFTITTPKVGKSAGRSYYNDVTSPSAMLRHPAEWIELWGASEVTEPAPQTTETAKIAEPAAEPVQQQWTASTVTMAPYIM